MSRGKHLSLEEARKKGLLDQFAKEHPNEGRADQFAVLLEAMTSGKKPEEAETSDAASSEGSSGTRSRPDKSGDT